MSTTGSTETSHKGVVAVIGAGPIGLEAAAAAAHLGYHVRVFERDDIGASVAMWGHVRMFTPWKYNRSTLGARLCREAGGFDPDPERCPTGDELVAQYLLPLASHALLRGRIATHSRVLGISREGTLKGDLLGKPERKDHRFRLLIERDGVEKIYQADIVIDASGTYDTPRWLGSGGLPAPGERHALITRHVPDVMGRDMVTYEGEKVLVVGSGLSAAMAVRDLARLAETAPQTRVVWAVRGQRRPPIEPVADDPLPERARLVAEANALSTGSKFVELRSGVHVERIVRDGDGARVTLSGTGGVEEHFDRVLSLVGYRPDPSLWEELQVQVCYATGAPYKTAAHMLAHNVGMDPLKHSSGGPEALVNHEPRFVVIGQKSYGRNADFLLRLGHEQVRDAMRLITGDGTIELK